MVELTPEQIAVFQRLAAREFQMVALPLYANAVGVRKASCAALLVPAGGGMKLFAEPCYLVDGNLSVRIARGGRQWFVWKKKRVEATPERLAELKQFTEELCGLLRVRA